MSVASVLGLMAGTDVMWWLSGGEALDVFVGRSTRAHADIDISLRRSDLAAFRAFISSRLDLKIAHDGQVHEMTDGPLAAEVNGLWARKSADGPWRLQVNLEPVADGEWCYRRNLHVRLPVETVIRRREVDRLPYVAPAVQLLWKAKDTRPKDEHDFETVAPLLTADERRWLSDAIVRSHPESGWPARLTACA
jgi:hypothetical protein